VVQVRVEGMVVLLVQEMVYACNFGEKDERRKKEVRVTVEGLGTGKS
jgi:hypothetical protein